VQTIWIVRLEVLAFTDSSPDKGQLGFINVVVAGIDSQEAEAKVRAVLAEYEWEVLGIEDVSPADPEWPYGADIPELIEDVMANPEHIRLSILHTYKPN
jgi:hypothetical protein